MSRSVLPHDPNTHRSAFALGQRVFLRISEPDMLYGQIIAIIFSIGGDQKCVVRLPDGEEMLAHVSELDSDES